MKTDQETCKAAASSSAPSQDPIKPGWLSSNKRGTPSVKSASDVTSRFQGDGVRYKAKLIGMDFVPAAQGEKMCLDSMMKLKGQEVAGRNQGRHKQRVWLKVSTAGMKILDERTGVTAHEHEPGKISSLTKDESDPRALSYIYNDEGTYTLFYIKMANLADPILDDIKEVCQIQQEIITPVLTGSDLLLLDENVASPKGLDDLDLFNPIPISSSDTLKQSSSKDELMDIFSATSQNPYKNQTGSPQSPSATPLSPAFPGPLGAPAPFISPVSIPWGQQRPLPPHSPSSHGPLGGTALWLSQPSTTGWTHTGCQVGLTPQPGGMWSQNTVSYPNTAAPFYTPQQPASPTTYMPYGTEGPQQLGSPMTYMPYGTEGPQLLGSPTTYMPYGTEGPQQPVSPTTYMPYGTKGPQHPR